MAYHPIFLDIAERPCVVIGGGQVAERKVLSLLDGGAEVTVISPEVTSGIERLARRKRIILHQRLYEEGDLRGNFLAYCATGRGEINRVAQGEARRVGVLLNVVDDPGLCDFITPALVRRGALMLAVSTSGECPAMARRIRENLEEHFGEEYAIFLELLGAVRMKLLKKRGNSANNMRIYEALLDSPLLEWIRKGSEREIDTYLRDLLGDGYTPSQLGIKIG
ncbi:MAG: bifunctional precorrin-2 dehydrogenase/sirohydrochlorin ferrochelatase [Thermodesulfobacteriota bacterium]